MGLSYALPILLLSIFFGVLLFNQNREKELLLFSDSSFRLVNSTRDTSYELPITTWWHDGPIAFTTQDLHLKIQCQKKALGLYKYVPLKEETVAIKERNRDEETNKYLIKVTINIEARYSKFEDGFEEAFRGLKITVIGTNESVLDTIDLTDRNKSELVLEIPRTAESLILTFACVGYSGFIYFNKLEIKAVVKQNFIKNSFHVNCKSAQAKITKKEYYDVHRRLRASITESEGTKFITLATHFTMDRFDSAINTLVKWGMGNFVVLIVYNNDPAAVEAKLTSTLKLEGFSQLDMQYITLVVVVPKNDHLHHEYPINMLRNIAFEEASTEFVFQVDVDMVPSVKAAKEIETALAWSEQIGNNIAFIAPAFEISSDRRGFQNLLMNCPSKNKLRYYQQRGLLKPYKLVHQPKAQNGSNYEKWWSANNIYTATDTSSQYEPYIVLSRQSPVRYDERFSGYGWNKVSYISELKLAGVEFLVLPTVWLLHQPHPKTKYSEEFSNKLRTRIANRIKRYEWLLSLQRSYKIGSCRDEL